MGTRHSRKVHVCKADCGNFASHSRTFGVYQNPSGGLRVFVIWSEASGNFFIFTRNSRLLIFHRGFWHSLSDQGALKLSTTKQGTVQTVPSSQKTVQHPTYCQDALRFSPSAQHAVQSSPTSSRDTWPFQPSQKSQKSIWYSQQM